MNKIQSLIYKYKSGDSNSINDLLQKRLRISCFNSFNDPCDPFWFYILPDFYLGEDEENKNSIIDNELKKYFCASFSKSYHSLALWNYYSNGMKGFCLEYSSQDIIDWLKKQKMSFRAKNVVYRKNKICLDELLENERTFESISKLFFYKGLSWKNEQETRIVIKNNKDIEYFYIDNICPKSIYIGDKSDLYTNKIIAEFAKANNINCYIIGKSYSIKNDGFYIQMCDLDN